ncbi:MAG: signal transduction protein [Desulfobacteraceae bacterium 4572_89]|nr:MAG: signal transduction protein [Desulfobacteraceae bacterium 4572_89]
MFMLARNVMDKNFHSLGPGLSITDAVKMFKSAGIAENKKIFGMMVMDSKDRLVGMISMYDILLFIQPKHIRILGEMEDLPAEPLFEGILNRVNNVRVEDLMTTDLIIVGPDTHLIMVMDIMIQKHIRRLPVVENNKVIGIVYRSDLFYHFMETMVDQ